MNVLLVAPVIAKLSLYQTYELNPKLVLNVVLNKQPSPIVVIPGVVPEIETVIELELYAVDLVANAL